MTRAAWPACRMGSDFATRIRAMGRHIIKPIQTPAVIGDDYVADNCARIGMAVEAFNEAIKDGLPRRDAYRAMVRAAEEDPPRELVDGILAEMNGSD